MLKQYDTNDMMENGGWDEPDLTVRCGECGKQITHNGKALQRSFWFDLDNDYAYFCTKRCANQ